MSYLYLFLQSNLLELPIYLWLSHWPSPRSGKSPGPWPRLAILVTIMNSMTHPIVFFCIMNLPLPYLVNILLAEAFAIFVEAILLVRRVGIPIGTSLLASFLANFLSWQLAPMFTFAIFSR